MSESKYHLYKVLKVLTLRSIRFFSSSDASSSFKHCERCIQYDMKLQHANVRIETLKAKMNELLAENQLLRSHIEAKPKSFRKNKLNCDLCKVDFEQVHAEQHLCLDQDSIECAFCPNKKSFKSTKSFLNHMNNHGAAINEARKKKLFKCDKCTLAYPMEVLLECHKKSHSNCITENIIVNGELDESIEIKMETMEDQMEYDNDDVEMADEEYVLIEVIDSDDIQSDDMTTIDLDQLPEEMAESVHPTSTTSIKSTLIANRKRCSFRNANFC